MRLNGISLDVRSENGTYDFHDFDVSYGDIKIVIHYYVGDDSYCTSQL